MCLRCARPPPAPSAAKYESAGKLLQLVRHAESDAWLSLGLAFYLSVLPLTRQLVSAAVLRWLPFAPPAAAARLPHR
jgi:hypothetical protein